MGYLIFLVAAALFGGIKLQQEWLGKLSGKRGEFFRTRLGLIASILIALIAAGMLMALLKIGLEVCHQFGHCTDYSFG